MNNKKIKTQNSVFRTIKILKKKGKKIVAVSGSFDVFHVGHLDLLKKAKNHGDILVVLLNSDSSIKKYKGPKRPINSEVERKELLLALDCVDFVLIFDEINPKMILTEIKPHIYCNGSDWGKDCIERKMVEENGGQVKILPLRVGLSTSNLINKIASIHNQKPLKAIFLDRDGTINFDKGYTHKKEDFKFMPYVVKALRNLSKTDYKIFIVTNQAGIGRGYYTQNDLLRLHNWLLQELKRKKIRIDGIYYCPHHPDDNCLCRKPKIDMLLQAVSDHGVSLSNSWMVGDDEKDVIMGREANLKTIKIGKKMSPKLKLEPNYYVKNLFQAVNIILNN